MGRVEPLKSWQPLQQEVFSVAEWCVFGVPDFFVTEVPIEIGSLKGMRVHAEYPTTSFLRFGFE